MAVGRFLADLADDIMLVAGAVALEYGLWLVYQPAALIVGGALGLAAWCRRNLVKPK